MTDFEKKEYKNLLTDYINASEKIKQLEKENKESKDNSKEPKYKVLMGCRSGGKQFAQNVRIIEKESQDLNFFNARDLLLIKNQHLEKENKKLKNKSKKLEAENEKLKKFIEIIKCMDISLNYDEEEINASIEINGYLEITKEKYFLSKEVLKNDK